jgi:hypothetical protein
MNCPYCKAPLSHVQHDVARSGAHGECPEHGYVTVTPEPHTDPDQMGLFAER